MSIMDYFRTAPAAQTASPSVTPNPAAGVPGAANGSVPAVKPGSDGSVPAIPIAAEGDKSPLANFDKLWEIDPNAKKAASLVPTISNDPKKLMEAARGFDFTKAIDPTTLEGITKGKPEAFITGINQAVQAAFAQSMGTTSNLITQALQVQEKTFNEQVIPDILRKHNISNQLRTDNKLFESPAAAPLLAMLENQFSSKYPTASAAEISQHAKEYLSAFSTELLTGSGKIISDPPKQVEGSKAREPYDWSKFVESAS